MDLEMSGLDPKTDHILEIATIITDLDLNILAQGPELVIYQENSVLEAMDKWNQSHHGSSGLIEKVKKSTISLKEAEDQTLTFIKKHVKSDKGILAGNSIWQDRRFINKYMLNIDTYLNYRMLDVSSIKILVQAWYQNQTFTKSQKHRALEDIKESIEELKFYRTNNFRDLKD
jgi:oligoribonuclease